MVSTNKITKSSILISINVMLFTFSKILNIADLTLLTISSMISCLSIIKLNIKYCYLILISSTICAIIFGLVEYAIIYLFFFGSYPIIKFYIEKFCNIPIEIFFKISYFNILFLIVFFLYSKLFLPLKITYTSITIFSGGFSILFMFYDLILTRIINFIYSNKILNNL